MQDLYIYLFHDTHFINTCFAAYMTSVIGIMIYFVFFIKYHGVVKLVFILSSLTKSLMQSAPKHYLYFPFLVPQLNPTAIGTCSDILYV